MSPHQLNLGPELIPGQFQILAHAPGATKRDFVLDTYPFRSKTRFGGKLTIIAKLCWTSSCITPILDCAGTSIYLNSIVNGLYLVLLRGEGSEALENEAFDVPTQRLIRSIGH